MPLPVSDAIEVLVAPCTSTLSDAPLYRLALEAGEATGLKPPSQIIVDKIKPVLRIECGATIGVLDQSTRISLDNMLSVVIGIAERQQEARSQPSDPKREMKCA